MFFQLINQKSRNLTPELTTLTLKLNTFQSQLQDLKQFIPEKDLLNTEVSGAPVGWHIAHSLLVINNVFESLKASAPKDYKRSFSFWKTLVILLRKIPRGRAKSPSAVLPPGEIKTDFLQKQWEMATAQIMLMQNFQKKAFFMHPFFKHLNRDETKKFLEIHTEHHLKIIREIRN